MKAFSAVLLISLAALAFGSEKKMIKTWMLMKAMKGCYGEEAMKQWLVESRQAMAKCAGTPVPASIMDFHMFADPSRMVQAFMKNAKLHREDQFSNMLGRLTGQQGTPSVAIVQVPTAVEDPMMKMMKTMMMMKMMHKMMGKGHNMMKMHPMGDMDMDDEEGDFEEDDENVQEIMRLVRNAMSKRQKRDHHDVDIFGMGEKLTEKLEMMQMKFQSKIGNMTCFLQELKMVDENMNLDLDGMVNSVEKYPIEDEFVKTQGVKDVKLCYAEATSVPDEVAEDCPFGPEFYKIKKFCECEKKRKFMTCMAKDVRMKLKTTFGSVEKLVEDTGIPEKKLIPMAAFMIHDAISEPMSDMDM